MNVTGPISGSMAEGKAINFGNPALHITFGGSVSKYGGKLITSKLNYSPVTRLLSTN